MKDYEKYVRRELQFLKYVPVIFLSAINGENVEPLIDLALMVYHQRKERIATRKLMKLLQFSNHKVCFFPILLIISILIILSLGTNQRKEEI